jgi:TRAP-type C4-dicarboxylate transport system substrate-binding protein
MRALAIAALLMMGSARAEPPVVLRFATVAPEGSPWARELINMTRQLELATDGRVHIKWYFNAVAGDELEQLERLKRGQLDGSGSGQLLCEQLAPSLRISHIPGAFQDRDEASAVLAGLRPIFDREAHDAGFTILGISGLGPSVFFLRSPAHTLDELRRVKLWRWDLDRVGIAGSREMGLTVEPLALWAAARAFDDRRVDGFVGIPAAALAFQWSAQAKYLLDLRVDYLFGCLVISDRALSKLSPEAQAAVREAGARLTQRYDDLGRRIDEELVGGLFQKQGMRPIKASDSFRAEFFEAARAARGRIAERFIPRELLDRVQGMLADYRAEHGPKR